MSSEDSINGGGGEDRAFLEAQPPTQHGGTRATAPPSAPSTTTRVTRSQALARLRRGETVNVSAPPPPETPATVFAAAAVPSPSAGAPLSESNSLDKVHDSAVDGTADTPAKKSSDDTSSHAAAKDGAVFTPPAGTFNVSDISGRDANIQRGGMRPMGDASVFEDGTAGATQRRARREGDSDDDDNDSSHDDDEDGSHGGSTSGKDTSSAGGERSAARPGVTPTTARDPTRTHRGQDGLRLAAAALPRMLALQRAFETEARHLYEFCTTQVVEWPALAVEWIPDRAFSDPERDYTLQYIAVGSQVHPSSGMANTVKVMEVAVPVPSSTDVMYGLYGDDDIRGAEEEDPELQEYVDPGKRFANVKGHFHCEQTLIMDAPVLKIRAMPAETNILAIKTASGFVGIYNTVQEAQEDAQGRTVPDALLRGHSRGGFGLSWNTLKPGYIASASDDGYVNYYDVSHRLTIDMQAKSAADPELSGPETQPIERLVGHRDIVTDCSWHSSQSHLLASSSMDGDVRIWDIRMSAGSTTIHDAHQGGATAAQFHSIGAFQLATAGVDGAVHLWDIRRTGDPVAELKYHGRSVTGLQWSPSNETVLASYGDDGRVVLWDLAKTSLPLTYSEDEVAPPEVSFVHIGHVGRVTDVSWNASKAEGWLMASADTTNGLHVYRPLQKVVQDYRMFE